MIILVASLLFLICECQTCDWRATENWSLCSKSCGNGSQTQEWRCSDNLTSEIYQNEECDETTKPIIVRSCNLARCGPNCDWFVTNITTYFKCDCNNRHQRLNVKCKCDGKISPFRMCSVRSTQPSLRQECPIDSNCYKWKILKHAVTKGSKTCLPLPGHIRIHATVRCVTNNTNNEQPVRESHCVDQKPTNVETVYLPKCPDSEGHAEWQFSLWGPCRAQSDGSLEQHRSVSCVNRQTAVLLSDDDCISENRPKPETLRSCSVM